MEIQRVAKFEKVSFSEYETAAKEFLSEEVLKKIDLKKAYDEIKIPKRATAFAAGYDFFTPFDIKIEPGKTLKFPSGIRCVMESNYFLAIFPRSSLGFKYRLQLDNTVGIIDADFSNSDNGGHIIIKITNDTCENKTVEIKAQQGYVQGILLQYAITYDDDVVELRNGGFGSTNKA